MQFTLRLARYHSSRIWPASFTLCLWPKSINSCVRDNLFKPRPERGVEASEQELSSHAKEYVKVFPNRSSKPCEGVVEWIFADFHISLRPPPVSDRMLFLFPSNWLEPLGGPYSHSTLASVREFRQGPKKRWAPLWAFRPWNSEPKRSGKSRYRKPWPKAKMGGFKGFRRQKSGMHRLFFAGVFP